MAVAWSLPETPTGDWRALASCRDADPDLFFPVGTTGPAVRQIEAAKAVCRSCPSLDPCLEFALRTGQDAGVWGATSEEERRAIRRARRRRAATGTA
jgi:WhiB family redox-sensing transcriptional regulator